jgi:hypothetical protein
MLAGMSFITRQPNKKKIRTMKTNYFSVTLVLVATVLLTGCGSQARVGPLRTESQSVELGDDRSVDGEINFGAGNLELKAVVEMALDAAR